MQLDVYCVLEPNGEVINDGHDGRGLENHRSTPRRGTGCPEAMGGEPLSKHFSVFSFI